MTALRLAYINGELQWVLIVEGEPAFYFGMHQQRTAIAEWLVARAALEARNAIV